MPPPERGEAGGIEVVLESLGNDDRPSCPHGPCILFERYHQEKKVARRFYACSSCRDRKQCGFFQNEDDKVSDATLKARKDFITRTQPPFSHSEYYSRFSDIIQLSADERAFCNTCHLLLRPADRNGHQSHTVSTSLSNAQLSQPTELLRPLENKKSNAQYLFSKKTVSFVVDMLQKLGYSHVLCVGTPSIHQAIEDGHSMLLDIDHRYEQFYNKTHFARYNMFNHHFFAGDSARKRTEKFVRTAESGQLCVLIDPPFGGLVDLVAHTLKDIDQIWRQAHPSMKPSTELELPVFWFFPYFMESRIIQTLPNMGMMDYKVDYANHANFQEGPKGRKHGSPVRIFTNIDLSRVKLPADEGYRYCKQCRRYVAEENVHCKICKACTSKDGKTYVHCDICERCVKPSRVHCFKCEVCQLPGHKCGQKPATGCHLCGDLTHKRRDCPQKDIQRDQVKRKMEMPKVFPGGKKKKRMDSKEFIRQKKGSMKGGSKMVRRNGKASKKKPL